jgi:hypothetical protein
MQIVSGIEKSAWPKEFQGRNTRNIHDMFRICIAENILMIAFNICIYIPDNCIS